MDTSFLEQEAINEKSRFQSVKRINEKSLISSKIQISRENEKS